MTKLDKCPLCKNKKILSIYKSNSQQSNPYNKFLFKEVFDKNKKVDSDLKLCLNCTLCFFDYRFSKKELDRLYSSEYSKKRAKYIAGFSEEFNNEKKSLQYKSFLVRKNMVLNHYLKYRRWKNSAEVLDFGGWHGQNIPDIANQTNKYILDKSKHKTSSEIKVINDLKNNKKFDFIMSTHVFEHLLSPLRNLKVLCSSLKKGGLIYLELPTDIVGLLFKPPMYEHINYFSRNSILKLADLANLEVLSIEIFKYPYSYHKTIAHVVLLQKRLKNKKPKNFNAFIKILNILIDIIQYIKVKIFNKNTINFKK